MGKGKAIAELVHDPTDPRLDDFRNVPDAELVRRRGAFVAEGRRVVERLLTESPLVTRALMLTQAAHTSMADVLAARVDVPCYVVPQTTMDRVAGFHIHRGCLAIGEYPRLRPWHETIAGARTVLVLESLANADNVGSIVRSAAAFGADVVLLDQSTTDPLYRKAIRTSMGATLVVPFARIEAGSAPLRELRARDFAVVAMTPAASAPTLRATAHAVANRPLALVLGHESEGVCEPTMAACEFRSRIAVSPRVDSLNVAVAAAIALYELRGERRP